MKQLIPKHQNSKGKINPKNFNYKQNHGYSYSELSSDDKYWMDSYLNDYKTRWDKQHPDDPYDLNKIKNNIKFYFGEYKEGVGGIYNSITDNITLKDFGQNKEKWAHELSHALRSNQGYNNFISRQYNVNEGTSFEEQITKNVYLLYNPDFFYNPYNHGEHFTTNSLIRERISQENGGIRGEKLNNFINKMTPQLLKNVYFVNGYQYPNITKENLSDPDFINWAKSKGWINYDSYLDSDKKAIYGKYFEEKLSEKKFNDLEFIKKLKSSLINVANIDLDNNNSLYNILEEYPMFVKLGGKLNNMKSYNAIF